MAIIIILRQVGSPGDTIAEITAERLGYTLIDNDIHVAHFPVTSWL